MNDTAIRASSFTFNPRSVALIPSFFRDSAPESRSTFSLIVLRSQKSSQFIITVVFALNCILQLCKALNEDICVVTRHGKNPRT
ncbi:hypothetical protein V2J09_018981 [Rumex salicifolius]